MPSASRVADIRRIPLFARAKVSSEERKARKGQGGKKDRTAVKGGRSKDGKERKERTAR